MQQSPYGMQALWNQGDLLIKAVALLLLIMSSVSWYLIATRVWQALSLRRAARATSAFWHAQNFSEGLQILDRESRSTLFLQLAEQGQAAVTHYQESNHDHLHDRLSLADWLSTCLSGAIDECAEGMQRGLPILASIGSTAPFIGLFGTVWGIYHALVGIGASGQAGIEKVAGPVGEALIMTAFGLAVAIPAVLGYNALSRANKGIIGRLNQFAHQLHTYFLTGAPLPRRGEAPARTEGF
jgi:biopolymer transport protein ExbB